MRFYLTTAIDFVNSRPPIVTAYENVTADVIAPIMPGGAAGILARVGETVPAGAIRFDTDASWKGTLSRTLVRKEPLWPRLGETRHEPSEALASPPGRKPPSSVTSGPPIEVTP
jgi:hypothetical protein